MSTNIQAKTLTKKIIIFKHKIIQNTKITLK